MWHEEKERTARRAPGDNVLPDQFQTVAAVLASDWCQKNFANIRITDQIAFLCVHAPRGHTYLRFSPPRLPSATKTRFAALLLIRGNYFRPYLSIPACAIEGQHTNENSPTISI